MPVIFGTSISAATYDEALKRVTVTGEAFADTQYAGVSNIEVSLTGANSWSSVNSIVSWGDTQAVGSFNSSLAAGTYDVRITSSDGEQATIVGAFVASGGGATNFDKLFFFFERQKS